MRKLLLVLVSMLLLLGCLTGCSKNEEPISLSAENINDYLSISVEFGNVSVSEVSSTLSGGKYYLSCIATITVESKKDYLFSDAWCYWILDDVGRWQQLSSSGDKITVYENVNAHGKIQLNKEGSGKSVIELYCYSDRIDRVSPHAESYSVYFDKLFSITCGGSVLTVD